MATIAEAEAEVDGDELLENGHVKPFESREGSAQLTCNLQVDYKSEELARIAKVTLSVDPELRPDSVSRSMKTEGKRLVVSFAAADPRSLRSSFSAFLDVLDLTNRTIEEFGPGTQYMPEMIA